MTSIKAAATARDASGKQVASGSDQGFHPARLERGQIALGYIYFDPGTSVPPDSTLSVQLTSDPAPTPNTYFADLMVTEVNNTGQQIVGTVKNPRDHEVGGPVKVDVFCVSPTGQLQNSTGTYAEGDHLAAGATEPFTADLYGATCPQFLVGASGFDQKALGG